MRINELIMDLEQLRNILGDVEVKVFVNGQEVDLDLAVMDNDRVVIASEFDARALPPNPFD